MCVHRENGLANSRSLSVFLSLSSSRFQPLEAISARTGRLIYGRAVNRLTGAR